MYVTLYLFLKGFILTAVLLTSQQTITDVSLYCLALFNVMLFDKYSCILHRLMCSSSITRTVMCHDGSDRTVI